MHVRLFFDMFPTHSDHFSTSFRPGFDQNSTLFRLKFDQISSRFRSISTRFRLLFDQLSISFDQVSINFGSTFDQFSTRFRSNFDQFRPLRWTMATLGYFSPMITCFRTMFCDSFNRGLLHFDALFRTTPDNLVELSSVCVFLIPCQGGLCWEVSSLVVKLI